MFKKILTLLVLVIIFCGGASYFLYKKPALELSEREVLEIRGKWRLDLYKLNQEEEKIQIEVVDHETYHWREVLKKQHEK